MAVTVGFFDGVHLGHRRVLQSLISMGDCPTVVTFWPHPRTVLGQDAGELRLLGSLQEKEELLREQGVEKIVTIPFTTEFASLTAEQFVDTYLIGRLHCKSLVLGYDNRLGSDGLDTARIAELCRSKGMQVTVVPPVQVEGITVSSTRIRRAIAEGDLSLAEKMLGRSFN